MPQWWSLASVWINECGTEAAWRTAIRRYAGFARRWHVLDRAAWERLHRACWIACIREALRHVTRDKWGVREACDLMIDALERSDDAAMKRAIRLAAQAAQAAWGAWWRSERVDAAAAAAAAAADAAEPTVPGWLPREKATQAAAADRIIAGWLDAMEAEIARADARS
jgi:hypothetical protein